MDILYINKEKILCNFEELSNVWDASANISLCLDIQIPDFELIVTELLKHSVGNGRKERFRRKIDALDL